MAVIGLFNLMNKLADGYQVEPDILPIPRLTWPLELETSAFPDCLTRGAGGLHRPRKIHHGGRRRQPKKKEPPVRSGTRGKLDRFRAHCRRDQAWIAFAMSF